MSGKYIAARDGFGAGSLSWTDDRIVAQLLSAAYRFDEEHTDASDLSGKVGAPIELTDKTLDEGCACCAKLLFREVRGDEVVAVVFHREPTGRSKQSATLIVYIDNIANFPMMPNGGDIIIDIDDDGIFRV